MNLHVSEAALASHARRRVFHDRIAAIHAYKVMKGINPSPYWPEMWMWDLVTMPVRRTTARMDDIINSVCDTYAISRPELLSPSRHALAVRARHVCCYLGRKLTRLTFGQIGMKLSRDHTTTIYAYRKVTADLCTDDLLAAEVDQITRGLA
jgi:hypothetical protein